MAQVCIDCKKPIGSSKNCMNCKLFRKGKGITVTITIKSKKSDGRKK